MNKDVYQKFIISIAKDIAIAKRADLELVEKYGVSLSEIYVYMNKVLPTLNKNLYLEIIDYINPEKLILEIADYAIKTGDSTRKIAEKFKISNATVHTYLRKKLVQIDKDRYEQFICKYPSKKTPEEEAECKKVRAMAILSLMKAGHKIEEIADMLGENLYSTYRAAEKDIALICEEEQAIATEILRLHSLQNLEKRGKQR